MFYTTEDVKDCKNTFGLDYTLEFIYELSISTVSNSREKGGYFGYTQNIFSVKNIT